MGIYPKELKAMFPRVICTPMFMAALFTTAKRWKQPKHPLMDEWINTMPAVYTYYGILCSFRKEGNPVTCYNADEPYAK